MLLCRLVPLEKLPQSKPISLETAPVTFQVKSTCPCDLANKATQLPHDHSQQGCK